MGRQTTKLLLLDIKICKKSAKEIRKRKIVFIMKNKQK